MRCETSMKGLAGDGYERMVKITKSSSSTSHCWAEARPVFGTWGGSADDPGLGVRRWRRVAHRLDVRAEAFELQSHPKPKSCTCASWRRFANASQSANVFSMVSCPPFMLDHASPRALANIEFILSLISARKLSWKRCNAAAMSRAKCPCGTSTDRPLGYLCRPVAVGRVAARRAARSRDDGGTSPAPLAVTAMVLRHASRPARFWATVMSPRVALGSRREHQGHWRVARGSSGELETSALQGGHRCSFRMEGCW